MDEFGLIDTFVAQFDVAPSPRGPGDDCAVLPPQGPSCVTTDAVVEGVHFTRRTFSLEDVGHKALAVNLSDLAAMGARPAWFTVALGLPDDVSPADLRKLGAGMAALARRHGVELIGGNVSRSLQLSLTLTLSGALDGPPLLRSGARAGDALYVSGPLGDAAAALAVLSGSTPRPALAGIRYRHPVTPSEVEGAPPFRAEAAPRLRPSARAHLLTAQRRPTPHLAFGQLARRLCSAGIDVSDGLAQDLGHLCRASGVGAELDSDALPLTRALLEFAGSREAALPFALTGGEDYVLLVAVRRPGAFEAAMAKAGFGAHRIGRLCAGSGVKVDGVRLRGRQGFNHR